MELVGEKYFEKLAMRSLFQDFYRNDNGSIIRCKMHDMVHDLAQYLTKNGCFNVEVDDIGEFRLNSYYEKARHSMIVLKENASFPISIFYENRLRSLVFHCDGWGSEHMYIETSKLFDHMSCLRALQFCYNSIKYVPIGVNKLIHLRYLDISENDDIKELPEVVYELYNLQTLNIKGCNNLTKLPKR
ncbi:hypothetical protein Dsin_014123 [Dipteronia sinensis]|uniref:Disease resistance protein winged helix domain-containing protein n=1 Tax=Dipteronia sinensis TaxID=43782 RepID=A0AAE0ALA8_9ROSI|nr:hypothetical protein Dsin_014123 [Dipteronia sinensis]